MDFKQFFENMEASVERTTQARDRAKQKAQKRIEGGALTQKGAETRARHKEMLDR
tara:strand:- start:193 stop:357 length:165 start_codon:yes stop_codon:yes gene_type:complete